MNILAPASQETAPTGTKIPSLVVTADPIASGMPTNASSEALQKDVATPASSSTVITNANPSPHQPIAPAVMPSADASAPSAIATVAPDARDVVDSTLTTHAKFAPTTMYLTREAIASEELKTAH